MRQSRSQVSRHEAEYNLELVECWANSARDPAMRVPPNTWAQIGDSAQERARSWVKTHELLRAPSRGLIAIHPGMGGSALNWSWDQYAELGLELVREGWSVVYTGGAADVEALSQVRQRVTRAPSGITFYDALVSQSLEDLGALFLLADVVVAPSTGPLHLAVALGRPVVGIYSPVRVQSARRWGPWHTRGTEGRDGASPTAQVALSPQVSCPAVFKCKGSACPHYFCMETVTPLQVKEQLRKIIHESHS